MANAVTHAKYDPRANATTPNPCKTVAQQARRNRQTSTADCCLGATLAPMPTIHLNGREFSADCDIIDVSVLSSPDEHWTHVDTHGHEHYWTWAGERGVYKNNVTAERPTLKWKRTGTGYYDDGTPYEIGDWRCRKCREIVYPATKPRQEYMAGLRSYHVDGVSVSEDVYRSAATAAAKAIGLNL